MLEEFDLAKKTIFSKAKMDFWQGPFNNDNDKDRSAARPKADKLRDHCHFTGKYCGAAH